MTNLSAYPVTVDGRRLDDLAVGLEVSALTLGGLRSGDQVLAGLDGEVASLNDAREPSTFAMGMLVKGTDQDGFVPAGKDGQATYRQNLEGLKHLLCKTGTLLDVRRVMDKADSALLLTGGRTNLLTNPLNGIAGALTEVRRNYVTDPHGLDPTKWVNYTGVGSITSTAAGAYSGAAGLVAAGDGSSAVPRVSNNTATQTLNFPVGTTFTLQAKIRLAAGGWRPEAVPFFLLRGPNTGGGEWNSSAMTTAALSGGWIQVSITGTIPVGATGAVTLNLGVSNGGVLADATCVFHLDEMGVEIADVILPWFTGGTAAADGLTYSWVGAANASASIASGLAPGAGSAVAAIAIGAVSWVNGQAVRVLHKSAVANATLLAFQGAAGAPAVAVGDRRAARLTIRQVGGSGAVSVGPRLWSYTGAGAATDLLAQAAGDAIAVPVDTTVEAVLPSTAAASTTAGTTRFRAESRTAIPAGTVLEYSKAFVEAVTAAAVQPSPYFDGSTAKAGWTGTPHASTSFLASSDVQANAKVVDSMTPEDAPGDYGRLAVALKLPGVYWRSLLALTWTSGPLTSGTAMSVSALESSSAPIGDAVVCLTGPANAGVQIMDDATGQFVRLNEALPAGSVWRVNADTWETRVGVGLTVDSADTAGTDKAAVTDQSGTYPRLLRLHPRDDGTGRRLVKIKVVGAGFTAATTLNVKARRAHL